MADSLRTGFCISGTGSMEIGLKNKSSSAGSVKFTESKTTDLAVLKNEMKGRQVIVSDQRGFGDWSLKRPANFSVHAQASICVSKSLRWWEKTLQSNMIEINSAQELVDSLVNAGDKLIIIDFYSPGCGGCKTLHPKICQLADLNPNAIFLKVNHEKLKTMCYSLNIHVLPFFRFYQGAKGRLCSFSCTIATIKKFKDALAKYGGEQCIYGPAKGLDESELLKLASNGEILLDFPSRPTREEIMDDLVLTNTNKIGIFEENSALVAH